MLSPYFVCTCVHLPTWRWYRLSFSVPCSPSLSLSLAISLSSSSIVVRRRALDTGEKEGEQLSTDNCHATWALAAAAEAACLARPRGREPSRSWGCVCGHRMLAKGLRRRPPRVQRLGYSVDGGQSRADAQEKLYRIIFFYIYIYYWSTKCQHMLFILLLSSIQVVRMFIKVCLQ